MRVGSNLQSLLPAQEEPLERADRFGRPHPLTEKMIFLVDSADQVLGRPLQEFPRDGDSIRRQRANLACYLSGLDNGMAWRNNSVDETGCAGSFGPHRPTPDP